MESGYLNYLWKNKSKSLFKTIIPFYKIKYMKIKYVTGNKIKLDYAQNKLKDFGIELEHVVRDIHEIQSDDKFGVATDKAKKAFEIVQEPLFVTDTFCIFFINPPKSVTPIIRFF